MTGFPDFLSAPGGRRGNSRRPRQGHTLEARRIEATRSAPRGPKSSVKATSYASESRAQTRLSHFGSGENLRQSLTCTPRAVQNPPERARKRNKIRLLREFGARQSALYANVGVNKSSMVARGWVFFVTGRCAHYLHMLVDL